MKKSITLLAALFLAIIFLLSFNHLFPFFSEKHISTLFLGIFGWITIFLILVTVGGRYWKVLMPIFTFFFLFGFWLGPYLEPPGDPLDHLRNTYEVCGDPISEINRTNRGLWQYAMLGSLICQNQLEQSPQKILRKIDVANGIFWGVSAAILYLTTLSSGLPTCWALLSVVIAFLFMGTSLFSYFSYYSFAPSFTSMWLYWIWIGCFFFRRGFSACASGVATALTCLPILIVNHIQEAVFLSLVVLVWLVMNTFEAISAKFLDQEKSLKKAIWWGIVSFFIGILFILPQFNFFQTFLGEHFPHNYWQANQEAVYSWRGIHLTGKIWSYRIADTLGFFGFLPLVILPLILWRSFSSVQVEKQWRVLTLGLLPFLVYCTPLFNFIWLSNCIHLPTHIRYYYRMCYSSLFWIPLVYMTWAATKSYFARKPKTFRHNQEIYSVLVCCVAFIVVITASLVRSTPVYGKLDFILLDSRAWWKKWRPMLEEVLKWPREGIVTDYMTGYVLRSVFDIPVKNARYNITTIDNAPKLSIDEMIKYSQQNGFLCLINLRDFSPTWVPVVTGHWSPLLANTRVYYEGEVSQRGMSTSLWYGKDKGECRIYR